MQEKVRVTLAVVFHNEEKSLPKLLESIEVVFAEECEETFEFLFVNNDSRDNSLSILLNWRMQNESLKIRIINRTENHLAKARTQCLELCNTPWLAFVDADAILNERWPKNVLIVLGDLDTDVVAVGGGSDYVGEQSWHQYAKSLARYFPMGKKQSQKVRVNHAPTNNYLLRKTSGIAVGGFDPFFDRVGEDLEFNVRLRTAGKILYDPLFSVQHGLPSTVEQWYRKMALYGRAQSFVFSKYPGSLPIEKFFPLAFCILINVFLIFYPLLGFVTIVLSLSIARIRFFFLTFLFYGLGEAVGFFKYIYLQMSHGSSVNQKSRVQ